MEFQNLPPKAFIREVGPRDGFQGIKEFIPTEKKIEFIDLLLSAGIKEMEITSFVSPKAIPQLADSAQVLRETKKCHPDVKLTALVPNVKGAELALAAGADELNFVFSASESHNRSNIRCTVSESVARLDDIIALVGHDAEIAVSIATSFMCPFEGRIAPATVKALVETIRGKGIDRFCLAETIGTCGPRDFSETLRSVKAVLGGCAAYLHIHDTFGMALLNVKAALDEGFSCFDSASGGLGGCPFAPGAAGNIATEDIVFFLGSIGAETGLDALKLVEVARVMNGYGLKTMGHLAASSFGRDLGHCLGQQ